MHRIERVAHTARFFADLAEEALDPGGPTYAAWLDQLKDMANTLYTKAPAAPLETYFELPEQEFMLTTRACSATSAICEALAEILEVSENREIRTTIRSATTPETSAATIQILPSPLNPNPYGFAIHWTFQYVTTLQAGRNLWYIIQSVDENTTADQVEATYTGHFDNTPQPMGGAGGNMKFRDEGDAATMQPVTTAGGSGTHRTPPLEWRKDN